MFVRLSAIEFILPFFGFIIPLTGEWPIEVAIPFFPEKSSAITPQLLRGSCNFPTVCC